MFGDNSSQTTKTNISSIQMACFLSPPKKYRYVFYNVASFSSTTKCHPILLKCRISKIKSTFFCFQALFFNLALACWATGWHHTFLKGVRWFLYHCAMWRTCVAEKRTPQPLEQPAGPKAEDGALRVARIPTLVT